MRELVIIVKMSFETLFLQLRAEDDVTYYLTSLRGLTGSPHGCTDLCAVVSTAFTSRRNFIKVLRCMIINHVLHISCVFQDMLGKWSCLDISQT